MAESIDAAHPSSQNQLSKEMGSSAAAAAAAPPVPPAWEDISLQSYDAAYIIVYDAACGELVKEHDLLRRDVAIRHPRLSQFYFFLFDGLILFFERFNKKNYFRLL